MAEQMPSQLDAGIEYTKTSKQKPQKKGKAMPWLLGMLAILVIYAIVDSNGSAGLQQELTPEQQELQADITQEVREYIEENGVPDDPSQLNLPEGSDIMVSEDGSWVVSTPDGQLISSPDALTPR